MRVAIVALGPSGEDFHPHDHYDAIYALPWDRRNAHHASHLFEMHPLDLLMNEASGRPDDYLEKLQEVGCELFMQRQYEQVPNATPYPLHAICGMLRRDYFGSSPAYMLAYAIYMQAERVTLWGVDLTHTIYDHQRPNLEWLIGFAESRATHVVIAPGGNLMQYRSDDCIGDLQVRYPLRYGYDPEVHW
jgi:hypothetical protein